MFSKLPFETIERILNSASGRDIINLSQVNRYLKLACESYTTHEHKLIISNPVELSIDYKLRFKYIQLIDINLNEDDPIPKLSNMILSAEVVEFINCNPEAQQIACELLNPKRVIIDGKIYENRNIDRYSIHRQCGLFLGKHHVDLIEFNPIESEEDDDDQSEEDDDQSEEEEEEEYDDDQSEEEEEYDDDDFKWISHRISFVDCIQSKYFSIRAHYKTSFSYKRCILNRNSFVFWIWNVKLISCFITHKILLRLLTVKIPCFNIKKCIMTMRRYGEKDKIDEPDRAFWEYPTINEYGLLVRSWESIGKPGYTSITTQDHIQYCDIEKYYSSCSNSDTENESYSHSRYDSKHRITKKWHLKPTGTCYAFDDFHLKNNDDNE